MRKGFLPHKGVQEPSSRFVGVRALLRLRDIPNDKTDSRQEILPPEQRPDGDELRSRKGFKWNHGKDNQA